MLWIGESASLDLIYRSPGRDLLENPILQVAPHSTLAIFLLLSNLFFLTLSDVFIYCYYFMKLPLQFQITVDDIDVIQLPTASWDIHVTHPQRLWENLHHTGHALGWIIWEPAARTRKRKLVPIDGKEHSGMWQQSNGFQQDRSGFAVHLQDNLANNNIYSSLK